MENIIISQAEEGIRLDVFLAGRYPDISRSKIQKQIKAGAITLNGKTVTPHIALSEGDAVIVPTEAVQVQEQKMVPRPDIKLNVVYEDDHVLVINKPTDLLVHPATGESETVVNAVLAHFPPVAAVGDKPNERPGVVHRLDKDASGLLVIAKTQAAFDSLKAQFKNRDIHKEYTVLVGGHVPQDEGRIELYIGRSASGGKMAARPKPQEGDRDAVTVYRREKSYGNADLLTVQTETGRTHQIRVHLNAIGNPVAGDPIYGVHKNYRVESERLFLHCNKLSFKHPVSGEALSFEAPLPKDLQNELNQLK